MCGYADHDFGKTESRLRILLKCYNNYYFLMACINLSKLCDNCKQLEYLGSNIHIRFNLYHFSFNVWNLPPGCKAPHKQTGTRGICNS